MKTKFLIEIHRRDYDDCSITDRQSHNDEHSFFLLLLLLLLLTLLFLPISTHTNTNRFNDSIEKPKTRATL